MFIEKMLEKAANEHNNVSKMLPGFCSAILH